MSRAADRDRYFRDIGAPPPTAEERRRYAEPEPEPVPFDDDGPPPHDEIPHTNGEDSTGLKLDPVEPLAFTSPAAWEGKDIPDREWLVRDWIPAACATVLAGDGAIGKTTLALQLSVSVSLALPDWIGGLIDKPGSVLFITAEEEEPEIMRRLAAICAARGVSFGDLSERLHVCCMPEEDCTLVRFDNAGVMQPTELWQRLERAIDTIRPSLVVLEAAADLFGGKENDRRQVSQFIRVLRRPALRTRCSILLLTHPSVTGRNTGTGEAGSTQWHNSVRSRLYLTSGAQRQGDDEDAGGNPDSDIRILKFMKSNYGPKGRPLQLRWDRGVYVPLGGVSSIERAAADAAVDETFLKCLAVRTAQGIDVGPNTGANYAPSVFAKMPEANGCRSKALAAAMERLLSAKRIKIDKIGSASKQKSIIVRNEG